MKKTKLLVALSLAALLPLLTACGGGGSATPSAGAVADAIPAPTTPTVPTATTLAGWTLMWSDEFEVDGLPDPSKWDYDTERNALGWHNNELQYYARARPENSRIENGQLLITARLERLTSASDYGGQNYTSARLFTRGRASWTYGFMEIRAKLPCGRGTWPAIWMLGSQGNWPDDGEIDIMEQTGQNKGEVLGTIHTRSFNFLNGTLGPGQGAAAPLPDACSAFHNYQLTWNADKIVIGVDGRNHFEYVNPKNGDTGQWPFDNPQYLLLNMAIGGDLGGIVDNTAFPAQLAIDYVRIYQR